MSVRTYTHLWHCGHRILLPVKSGNAFVVPPSSCLFCQSASTIRWSTAHAPQATSPDTAAVNTSPLSSVTPAARTAQTSTPQARIPTEPLMNVMEVMVRG